MLFNRSSSPLSTSAGLSEVTLVQTQMLSGGWLVLETLPLLLRASSNSSTMARSASFSRSSKALSVTVSWPEPRLSIRVCRSWSFCLCWLTWTRRETIYRLSAHFQKQGLEFFPMIFSQTIKKPYLCLKYQTAGKVTNWTKLPKRRLTAGLTGAVALMETKSTLKVLCEKFGLVW